MYRKDKNTVALLERETPPPVSQEWADDLMADLKSEWTAK